MTKHPERRFFKAEFLEVFIVWKRQELWGWHMEHGLDAKPKSHSTTGKLNYNILRAFDESFLRIQIYLGFVPRANKVRTSGGVDKWCSVLIRILWVWGASKNYVTCYKLLKKLFFIEIWTLVWTENFWSIFSLVLILNYVRFYRKWFHLKGEGWNLKTMKIIISKNSSLM